MTRLKMDWLAKDAAAGGEWKHTFRTMIYITLGYFLLNLILSPADPDEYSVFYNILVLVYSVFMIYLVTKVRREVRRRNEIPEEKCVGCEDVVCAAFCGCCTVSQLARQTADYDLDEAQFLTPDGLAPSFATRTTVLNV
jgi:Cys-rich protein (TIGR01571 family)